MDPQPTDHERLNARLAKLELDLADFKRRIEEVAVLFARLRGDDGRVPSRKAA